MPSVVLEWWQWIVVALGAFGFSAAPWILALLGGKLVQGRLYDQQVKRADAERDRADAAIAKLGEFTTEFGETTVKLLSSIPKKGGATRG